MIVFCSGTAISRKAQFSFLDLGWRDVATLPFENAVCNLQHFCVQRKWNKESEEV